MIQGTTPTHIFKTPLSTENLKNVRITYAQDGVVVLTKELADCTVNGNEVMCQLSQEETFKFDSNLPVDIQFRALTNSGDAMASRVQRVAIVTVLDGAVLA